MCWLTFPEVLILLLRNCLAQADAMEILSVKAQATLPILYGVLICLKGNFISCFFSIFTCFLFRASRNEEIIQLLIIKKSFAAVDLCLIFVH